MTLISGLSTALMTPKIAATPSSVPVFDQSLPASNWMPGTNQVATARAAAETTTRRRNLITPDITRLLGWVRKGTLAWVRGARWGGCARGLGVGAWGSLGWVRKSSAAPELALRFPGSGAEVSAVAFSPDS